MNVYATTVCPPTFDGAMSPPPSAAASEVAVPLLRSSAGPTITFQATVRPRTTPRARAMSYAAWVRDTPPCRAFLSFFLSNPWGGVVVCVSACACRHTCVTHTRVSVHAGVRPRVHGHAMCAHVSPPPPLSLCGCGRGNRPDVCADFQHQQIHIEIPTIPKDSSVSWIP